MIEREAKKQYNLKCHARENFMKRQLKKLAIFEGKRIRRL